ncbi:MAG: hypothetical protein L0196_03715 [candidate division Zixibacteria bacterium]|nr:hypothetical protein [candidate division Zixibacteria bacterium]
MHSLTRFWVTLLMALGWAFSSLAQAQTEPLPKREGIPGREEAPGLNTLPPLPEDLPGWFNNKGKNHIFYKRGPYNFDIYNIKRLAYDLNAVAVGHSMAYEDMVTGKAAGLDTETFERINWVLNHPPKFMPDEANVSPTFGRKYGVLELVFDWTHILHAQTVDVLASTKLSEAEKDREIQALWKFYFESVPYAISPLPMNMAFLDGQPYSMAFRNKYPKVNGLFWGYHWLQGAMYDMLLSKTLPQQRMIYDVLGDRYHAIELYRTNRPFMPMFAETSPRFSEKYPYIANAFDNLHMLHDMVNDILASDWIPEPEKEKQILRAIWIASATAHQGERPGDVKEEGGLHDHRHMVGMPGMGMMKYATEDVMWMDNMGWMPTGDCHHCTMPLPEGEEAWKAPTVSAQGWTMRVRCPLCARDMAAETKGAVIFHIPTEDPLKPVVIISDEQGNLTTDNPGVLFLEEAASHRKCNRWSSAFSSRKAFEEYVATNPEFKDAKPLSFEEWAAVEVSGKKPDTYVKPEGPEGNPYDKAQDDETQAQKEEE